VRREADKRKTKIIRSHIAMHKMESMRLLLIFVLGVALVVPLSCRATVATLEDKLKELPIPQYWSGDYTVSALNRLPVEQQKSPVGYFNDAATFADVWHAFKLGEEAPEVDFRKHLVVFSRNVTLYNQIGIVKALLRDGVAEILTIENRSALPIEDKVAMAMAMIPRAGVKFIVAGNIYEAQNRGEPITCEIEGKQNSLTTNKIRSKL
jgi:hypothetical protein